MIKLFSTITALLMISTVAHSQGTRNCGPRETVVERLQSEYGETRKSIGLGNDASTIVEVFASDDSGTWTITVTSTSGVTCLIASGQDYSNDS